MKFETWENVMALKIGKLRKVTKMLPLLLVLALLLDSAPVFAAADTCPIQPVPQALDSLRAPKTKPYRSITFSATPSLISPNQAWIVQAYLTGVRGKFAKLKVMRLQVEHDCNRYFVIKTWSKDITGEEFEDIRKSVRPFLESSGNAATSSDTYVDAKGAIIFLDGTSIAVETETKAWRVRRKAHIGHSMGADISSLFHSFAARLIPSDEMPDEAWRKR